MSTIWINLFNLFYLAVKYLPALLLVVPVAVWVCFNFRTNRPWRTLLLALGIPALAFLLVLLIANMAEATRNAWSADRLAPAVAWVKGYPLYYPPQQGPVLVRMYGPVSALVYAPVGLADDPTTALLIGVMIDFLALTLPMVWLIRRHLRGSDPATGIAVFAVVLAVICWNDVLRYSATKVTIDAPAIGLAVAAAAVLDRASGNPLRSGAICGLFAALSIWCKQTLAPIVPAILLYAVMSRGWKWVGRFSATMLGMIAAVSLLFILWLGAWPVVFNLYALPAMQPWKWSDLSTPQALLRAAGVIEREVFTIAWLLVVGILLRLALSRQSAREFRNWAADQSWLLLLLMAIFVIPTTAAGYAKIGGQSNAAAPAVCFTLLAAVIALGQACVDPSNVEIVPPRLRTARLTLAVVLAVLFIVNLQNARNLPSLLKQWTRLDENGNEIAYRLARQHPNRIYFPQFPLATLFAEGRAYHFDQGIIDQEWAGMDLSKEQIRQGLPPDMHTIAVFGDAPDAPILKILPEYKQTMHLADLPPGWTALTNSSPTTSE